MKYTTQQLEGYTVDEIKEICEKLKLKKSCNNKKEIIHRIMEHQKTPTIKSFFKKLVNPFRKNSEYQLDESSALPSSSTVPVNTSTFVVQEIPKPTLLKKPLVINNINLD